MSRKVPTLAVAPALGNLVMMRKESRRSKVSPKPKRKVEG
jgi:hypothetical protein